MKPLTDWFRNLLIVFPAIGYASGIVALLFTFTSTVVTAEPEWEHGLTYAYGTPAAPALVLADTDGHEQDLADYRQQVIIVNFWATWCPPCVAELPTLSALYQEYRNDGLQILAVNLSEDLQTIRQFAEKLKSPMDFPVLLAEKPEDISGWEIRALPATFIINKSGNLEFSALGPRDFTHPSIRERIVSLLNRES